MRIEAFSKTVPVAEVLASFVDVEKFLRACRACPNYGKNWACPPDMQDARDIWRQFDTLQLELLLLYPEGEDTQEFLAVMKKEKERLLHRLLQEEGRGGRLALSAGVCELCRSCARTEGKPCRHPEKMRRSIESLGGDVSGLAERCFGKLTLWLQDGKLPEYMMLMGGLLY